jgi:hypothetical protein
VTRNEGNWNPNDPANLVEDTWTVEFRASGPDCTTGKFTYSGQPDEMAVPKDNVQTYYLQPVEFSIPECVPVPDKKTYFFSIKTSTTGPPQETLFNANSAATEFPYVVATGGIFSGPASASSSYLELRW